ncbi:hypothetical protein [Paenibacillus sp. Marseille-Q4541]|uniref:hypothetical protein n=1 Tax=Paenibacillus sp. Marseille-Q4541 TaxID=2831522 RepID=UPI001BA7899D|nr:hypothetical protein [Paenibacillus sp. Marseille-Q4541]
MKFMDIDHGRDETRIVIKDTLEETIKYSTLYKDNYPNIKELCMSLIDMVKGNGIDFVHIDTSGFGVGAYGYLKTSEIGDRVVGFRYTKFK